MSWEMQEMTIDEAKDHFAGKAKWPVWLYAFFFFVPALATFGLLYIAIGMDALFSGIVSLAIMNGSINSVIAYITIKLDDKSSESLQHLEFINNEMDKLESTLEEANEKVTGFTSDLDEAKEIFRSVGVDLTGLDLESVSDVVEKLKENKSGLNSVLDNLRNIEVDEYISQAKRINWKQLLGAAEEIMSFIQERQPIASDVVEIDTSQIKLSPSLPTEEADDWVEFATTESEGNYNLLEDNEEVSRDIKMPKPTPRLTRNDKKLTRDSKPRLSLSRR
ncbi:MAG: hypothetical protein CBB67_004380 [Alteromonadaceae bacterium TMED7]|uniref:hypothetical protein n=1 Tax=Alteromonas sp. TaxID=232 RepID=UPI000B62C9A0|nr:hypothetical protein [Alteromonas sp.]MAI37399.1 hypothetical protein [Alteromonas sp.]RPH21046.1 MAG: hypothetical protein CBB67_004380 [Alteromonadaceae bacterium TMED7]|tara:strand:- start:7789 stop:8619 length:831 start_codon:yes stop_codon:yes gene_type:complete